MKIAAKRVFSCKDRRRYSRKRAKFAEILPKIGNYPTGPLPYGPPPPRDGDPVVEPRHERGLRARFRSPAGCPQNCKISKIGKFWQNSNFWQARSRLYQNEILQENMRLTAFFKFYKI